jgi:hypothetical protein
MTEYRKRKAESIAKSLIAHGLSSTAVARSRGTTPQNESQKARRKDVQDCLKKFIDSPKLKQALIEVGIQGLKADKQIGATILIDKGGEVIKAENEGAITVPDYQARHRYWHDLLSAAGALKQNEDGNGPVVNNALQFFINYAEKDQSGSIKVDITADRNQSPQVLKYMAK